MVGLHPAFYDRVDRSAEKYGVMFAELLDHEGVAGVAVADAALADPYGSVLDVVFVVPDVADWQLRYQIQDVARKFEEDYAKSVVCRFRTEESVSV